MTMEYRLKEFETEHNIVDAVWRMFGAFHLLALLLSGNNRVLHHGSRLKLSVGNARHPFLLFLPLENVFIHLSTHCQIDYA